MSSSVNITLVLKEREPAKVRELADDVSNPLSDNYGKFLNAEALSSLVNLPDSERSIVLEWLTSEKLEVLQYATSSPQLVFVTGDTEQIQKAFGRDLIRWINRETDELERVELAIPRRIAGYIQKVGGRPPGAGSQQDVKNSDLQLPHDNERSNDQWNEQILNSGFTPNLMRELYNYPREFSAAGETIAVLVLGGELNMQDLRGFCERMQVPVPEICSVEVGPKVERRPTKLHDLETTMTVEWLSAMAPGAKIVLYKVDPAVMGDPWSAFLFAVLADKQNSPSIATMSWITPERQYYGLHGREVIAGLLDQAALRGITVLCATGDWGPFDGIPRTIRDGLKVADAPWPHGVFPAVEPKVLAVGGSMITAYAPHTEIAWSGPPPPGLSNALCMSQIAGSGGFSRDIPIPTWQRGHLRGYYARGAAEPAVVPYGRGFPDVSLAAAGKSVQLADDKTLTATGYLALLNGVWINFAGGTSIAAPIWAGIIAGLNRARLSAGKSRLGFCNPLLYKLHTDNPECFRRVTVGAADVVMNVLNQQGKAVPFHFAGYNCSDDWNPVTGLGVPRVNELLRSIVG